MAGRPQWSLRARWPGFRSRTGLWALILACGIVVVALIPVAIAQSRRAAATPSPPLQAALRALVEGRYDEVAKLTAPLDQQDPAVVAVNARALIARGEYQRAETLLRPSAGRAPGSDAALELGLLLKMLGRQDAVAVLSRVAASPGSNDDGPQLSRSARALQALDRFQEANSTFREAAAAAPSDPAINTAWGDLFLEKYNKQEALKSYQAALQDDPKWAPALLGAAKAFADEDPPQSASLAAKALEINPSYVDAHVFLAAQALDASHRDEAQKSIQKALEVNPSSLEVRSLVAGMLYVEDKKTEFQAEVDKLLAIAPNFGEVYRVAGEQAARNYRFDEAVELVRRGIALRPNDPHALVDLGIHLLRTGDEPGARTALESSFKLDAFNVVTYNLLQMMDTLDKFVTVEDGDLIVRMDKNEAPVLRDYAVSLSHQALKTLSAKYQFTPKGPFLIEIFPKHDDFAVRNVGLPGMIGALGACFGRVVTMDSPNAGPRGQFQWEATLWHELAHVITIQMSNQRIPRWLTEGISVYEEKLARPEWARGQDMVFAQMLNETGGIKLKDLNEAFTDPKTISIAYFEASLLVDHIVQTFGDDGLHKLVRAYAKGIDTEAALKDALNTDFDQMQTGFDRTLDRSFGALRKALALPDKDVDIRKMPPDTLGGYAASNPGSYPVQLVYTGALRKAGQPDEAMRVFERAAALVPIAAGPDSPHAQMADIAIEKGDRARAIRELQALIKVDFDNVAAARKLASLLKEAKIEDTATLRPVYERIVAIDPFDSEAHTMVGRFAMERNDIDAAVREFKSAVVIGAVDQAGAHTDLAESYLKSGKRAEARRETLAALEIAPSYQRAQDLLLNLTEAR